MKNFLWFIHKPADEREETLFNTAYRNSLAALWIGISFLFITSYYLAEATFQASFLCIASLLLLFTSYLSGWISLRNEDLTYKKEGIKKLPQAWLFLLFFVMIQALAFTMVYFFPEKYFSIFIVSIVAIEILLMTWAFESTKYLSTHIRLIVSLIIPTIATPFAYFRQKSLLKRVLIALGFNVLIAISILGGISMVRALIVEPIMIGTTIFEPELKNGQSVLIDKRAHQYNQNDYIILKDEQGLMVAKIVAIKNEEVLITTSTGEKNISLEKISGKILLPST